MPIPLPKLDNRKWSELAAEGRALLPRKAPSWTDHNIHDPGITAMELFAWLAENLLFRLDRISPAAIRSFLRWAGVSPRPPQSATTVLALRGPTGVVVNAGTQVQDPGSRAVFQSIDAISLSAAWIDLNQPNAPHRARLRTVGSGGDADHAGANAVPGREFDPFGTDPQPGDSFRIDFDVLPAAPGARAHLYVWTTRWASDDLERARIGTEADAIEKECALPPVNSWASLTLCADAQLSPPTPMPTPPSTPPGWWQHYSALVVWEYWTGAAWKSLANVLDQTRALTLSGTIEFTGPPDHAAGPDPGFFSIRCRLDSGGFECPPRLSAIAINPLVVRHAATLAGLPETLGRSDGTAQQSYRLGRAPVVASSTRVSLTLAGVADDRWSEVLEWDRTEPDDSHYRLQPETGEISFGDGRTGRVPPAASTIAALNYQTGGGSAGNLATGRLTQLVAAPAPGIDVFQPFPAIGGTDAETVSRAHGRALLELGRATRAVTTADCEMLARETPGVPVGRAHAIAGRHPDFPCLPAPGVVTLVVLPACGRPPVPGRSFLAGVQRYVERRRPLATEIHVIGPEYTPVVITARIHADSAAGAAGLAQRAQATMKAFFDPLHGGLDGSGWPFAHGVYEVELLALLGELAGVDFVEGLVVSAPGVPNACGYLCLSEWGLVDLKSASFEVVVR
jgi:hypothetical protein